ncbi:MAG: hypothetical protein LBF85_05220 [Tannerella sp.]|jgi:hypothetical protein|nr:hypothetical protein [Tannerella sp.]
MIELEGLGIVSDIVLPAAYVVFLLSAKDRRINWGIAVTLLISLFYLAYSFFVAYNSTRAIALDFLMQVRPYLTFFIVMQMMHSFSDSQKRLLKKLSLSMWVFLIPLSIYGLINPVMFAGMVSQPVSYVSGMVILSLLYLYCSGFSLKERLTFLLMLSVGLIVVHARFYGFFVLTCAILIFFYRSDILLSKLRTGIALALVLGVTIYISEAQISDYLSVRPVAENDSGFAARATLYQTAGVILKDFFPLGSGFASFATHASKTYYSQIYSNYGLGSVNGLTPQEWFPVSDSYYPSLAQFGIVGIVLYLLFWAHIVWLAFSKLRKKDEIHPFVVVLILISFVFIENVFDSFFTSNKGVFIMMFLGIIFSRRDVPAIHRRKKRHFIPLETTRLVDVENAVSDATFKRGRERAEAGAAKKTGKEGQTADTPATVASVPAPPACELELPDAAMSDGSAEEEKEDEYDYFEEYCEDESDEHDGKPVQKADENETDHRKTDMEKEFQAALEKIKAHAEEKRRLLKEKEAAGAANSTEEKNDPEARFDYII